MAYVEVDLDNFSDEEISDEFYSRGLELIDDGAMLDMDCAILYYNQGNIKETMIMIERAYPELRGLAARLNCEVV